MDDLTETYCLIDDFYKAIEPQLNARLLTDGKRHRSRKCSLSLPELMTLVVLFHQIRYRQFKSFYLNHVCQHLRAEFPQLPTYQRCVEWLQRCAIALAALFEALTGKCSGVSIADSTPIAVCENLRISSHRVFQGMAARGKSSTGWFFGFKLHLVINHLGEWLGVKLTPGNVDDRKPLCDFANRLFGKLYADKGYIAKWLTAFLRNLGIDLVTRVKKNMKPVALTPFDEAMLRQRSLVETVIDELKNLCQVEHTRHRSPINFTVNLLAGLIAYCLMPNKPRLSLQDIRRLSKPPKLIPN
ncbi:MAG: IS982 family transposase [Candidatus Accumulibacter cognatus]|uniref:IS982 family transposase n=1 Tax=Candidatus Accumulibacter cognatus TaxID=2954383 RepID=A0A7D5N9M5_9PROT|nr:MAG: IS982 family transposase [Candidatus Accumulibacter cognatus]